MQLREGDGLALEDGRVLAVLAAPEALLEVSGKGPEHLLQLAWHLGNRHLATQIRGDRLLIRYDHVIAHMLEHLGATVRRVIAPFDPEGGAYGGAHGRTIMGTMTTVTTMATIITMTDGAPFSVC